jgi:hypothetical protein
MAIGPNRFVVLGRKGKRRVFTDWEDAIAVAKKCSRTKRGTICRVLHGYPGNEVAVLECRANRCAKPHPKSPRGFHGRRQLRDGRPPPPRYFTPKGPPPGVPIHASMLKGARRRRRKAR